MLNNPVVINWYQRNG